MELKLWNDDMKNHIIAANGKSSIYFSSRLRRSTDTSGSIQNIPTIPDDVKAIYKTVWELSQKKVLDLAADRGAFICQSQSLNVHLANPTMGQLVSSHGSFARTTNDVQFLDEHALLRVEEGSQDGHVVSVLLRHFSTSSDNTLLATCVPVLLLKQSSSRSTKVF